MPKTFAILVRILVVVFTVNAFIDLSADPDLWGHLKFGEHTWIEKAIPLTDTYSYTASGLPWINHEWLTEVLFYLIYSAAGSTGLLLFKLAIGLLIVFLLSSLYFSRAKNPVAYAVHFFLLTPVLAFGFATRPQLITWLFLTLLVVILQSFFAGNRKAVYWMPLLMLVWINSHGGAVAGIAIFGMVTAVELVRGFLYGEKDGKRLLPFFILSCGALFVNPYGYKLLLFFLQTIPKPREITEWMPVPLFDTSFLCFKILALLFFATLLHPRTQKRPWEIAMILFSIYYGFRHQRHTVLMGILLTPYLPLQLAKMMEGFSLPRFSSGSKVLVHSILIAAIGLQTYDYFHKLRGDNFQMQVNPQKIPLYAVQFMDENDINGNILLPFGWGEYVIWKLPESKVSTDGRFRTVYPDKVFLQNHVFRSGWEGWQYMLDLYPTDIVLLDKINQEMKNAKGWVMVYEDPVARVFLRQTDPPGPLLARFLNKEFVYSDKVLSETFP